MRPYERTHPWLKFQLDLRRASKELWLRLGEAQSKCEHIAGTPLKPATGQKLHQVYLAKGVLATTAIEGNTLTEAEVLQLLEGKLHLPKSKEYLRQEIENVVKVCNEITSDRETSDGELTVERIRSFNRSILKDLEIPPDTVVPGVTRPYSVVVGPYKGAPHEDCDFLLKELCSWLNEPVFRPAKEERIAFAVLRAVLAHLYLAWIHPFGDGNGRTARMVEFFILLSAGVPSPAAHLLSNHYNQTRSDYYRQLQFASSSGGDVFPFLQYAATGFVDGLRSQIEAIRVQQWNEAWCNYVDEQFGERPSASQLRQKNLVLDLSEHDDWLTAEIPKLSPSLAASYATKQAKTISRDVNSLIHRGLIEKRGTRVRARREIILAFLPPRKQRS
ncbi:hypothetical protein CLG94_00290 [Candidatus Methylomirabilis limnetica]|uniref:Fido domain-containing protein n=1 Tax=Candidatus Methylomirabilis limnetica TaxID=2033718 RepID=A0A2T4U1L5_9BACT|nr:Fic family protein [Candidatus Methylomirabilis limnetica]PTL37229.1 hypothetical protein CLG94_00290 [Candidatus Methylomirabilis limnetica]